MVINSLLTFKKKVRFSILFSLTNVLRLQTEALRTDSSLSSCRFTKDDILRIISNLDPNKAHGYDEISIRMLKICGDSICRPLNIIFKTCLRTGIFPLEWKKANVVPIHKKGDKQTVINYFPVSLLLICGKIFERLLYNEMSIFFLENDLIS